MCSYFVPTQQYSPQEYICYDKEVKKAIGIVGVVAVFVVLWWFFFAGYEIVNDPPRNDTIVAFGDSLVFGTGATQGNDFVSVLSRKIGKPIINLGVPGDTTTQGLARISDVLEEKPGIVLVLLGGNDYLRKVPPEQTIVQLRTIITTLQKDGALVVLLGVRGGILHDGFSRPFAQLAEETGSLYVSDVLEGLIGNMTYMSDGVHPNDAGYATIAERVYKVIAPYVL